MKTRAQAADHINGTIDGDYVYYHDDGTGEDYRSDVESLDYLVELLNSDDEAIASDAYSHWCAATDSELVRYVRQHDLDAIKWLQCPRDGGQMVDVHYAADETGLYRREHDRSDRTTIITWHAYDDDADEDALAFEPWNGQLPSVCGESYVIRGN